MDLHIRLGQWIRNYFGPWKGNSALLDATGERDGGGLALPSLHRAVVRHITKGGMVIRGHEIHSRGGPKGRVQAYLQTWWCLVLTEAVMQEVFDLNPVGRG